VSKDIGEYLDGSGHSSHFFNAWLNSPAPVGAFLVGCWNILRKNLLPEILPIHKNDIGHTVGQETGYFLEERTRAKARDYMRGPLSAKPVVVGFGQRSLCQKFG